MGNMPSSPTRSDGLSTLSLPCDDSDASFFAFVVLLVLLMLFGFTGRLKFVGLGVGDLVVGSGNLSAATGVGRVRGSMRVPRGTFDRGCRARVRVRLVCRGCLLLA